MGADSGGSRPPATFRLSSPSTTSTLPPGYHSRSPR
jgi:hypothetical protein